MNRRLAKLEERRKALLAQSNAILDAADKEDRPPTEDEQKTLDANTAELKTVSAGIDREVELSTYNVDPPAVGFADFGVEPRIVQNRTFEDDPKKGFRNAREFFVAVMEATVRGETTDDRLRYLSGRRSGFLAAAGADEQGTYSDPYGNFLVPTGFLPNLLQIASEGDPTAGRTTLIPMASPRVDIPARSDKTHTTSVTGGLVVYRRSETQKVTETRMALELVSLTAAPLMGLTYATEELLSDSAISFVALIEAGFRDEFAAKILYEKLHGAGAGSMEGVLNTPCLVSVAKETGQDADSIVYENIINMRSRCWGYQNAIWLYNHDCLPQLMSLVMPIGTGGVPLWQVNVREGEPDTLLGRPCFATEFAAKLGDAGDLILGNWSQYLEGVYQPLESAESMHVRFLENERTFRFTMRNDGRCWWRAALTPKKATATLSPFVIVAERA